MDEEYLNTLKLKVSKACVYVHKSIDAESKVFYNEHKRHYYVTPILYVEFLKIFKKLFETKKAEYIVSRLQNVDE
jgi:hypothetical protein